MARQTDIRCEHVQDSPSKTMGLKLCQAMFDILESDIVVMQETKIQKKDLRDDMVLVPGWDVYFSLPRHKKGMYIFFPMYTKSAYTILTIRLFWCCHIYAERRMCSYPSRGRHHWYSLSTKFLNKLLKSSKRSANWRISYYETT